MNFVRTKCIATDLSVPVNTTVVDGVGFTAVPIPIGHASFASLTLYILGTAGTSKGVTFNFVAYDSARAVWDTQPYLTLTVPANGTAAVQQTFPVYPDVELIKLGSITNFETTGGYAVTVNASVFMKT